MRMITRHERMIPIVTGATSGLDAALTTVGDRWTLLVIDALQDAPRRFNDLMELVPGIAPNILSTRLKRLEEERLVIASPYSTRPLRVVYELTAAGRELAGAVRLLAHWGARHVPTAEMARHELCGTPLEPRWHCPSCDRVVETSDPRTELDYL